MRLIERVLHDLTVRTQSKVTVILTGTVPIDHTVTTVQCHSEISWLGRSEKRHGKRLRYTWRDEDSQYDLAQSSLDRRRGVRTAHCENVPVPIGIGNAHTAGFLSDADDGARHWTDRRASKSHVQ